MTTSKIQVTEGSGVNIGTNSISEDAVTKQLQRVVLNKSDGTEVSPLEASIVRGVGSVNGVASVALIAAAGAGIRNYITDVTVINTGATTSRVDFTDGDGSVLGRTIAPTGGGSNIIGLRVPMRTSPNQPFNLSAATASSTISAFAYGYKA